MRVGCLLYSVTICVHISLSVCVYILQIKYYWVLLSYTNLTEQGKTERERQNTDSDAY